jgi:predicted MPP superfamily phosphohydrolase
LEPIPDFSQRRNFPGTLDNEFDIVLRRVEDVEKIPSLLFAGLLFLLALLPTMGDWPWTAGLWLFFLADWLLLALLPRAGRSYGPAKPPTLILAVLRALFAFLPFPIDLALQTAGTLLVIYAFWIEPHRLTVAHQVLRSPKLRAGKPVRLLHLGDLHVERITARERRLNRLVEALQPDLILFSGDVLNLSNVEDPRAWQAARAILSQWRAPGGVFVVTGSPAVDLEHVFPLLVEGLPHRWLQEERVTVEINGQALDLVGLTCTHRPFVDGPRLEALVAGAGGNFTVLLYHTPDLAPNAANTGKIDLQLSGHTHGGQLRLPWFGALFAASLYGKRFEVGRSQVGSMVLYVTRGIGLEGKAAPRMRFLCPPEIILWEIDGVPDTSADQNPSTNKGETR